MALPNRPHRFTLTFASVDASRRAALRVLALKAEQHRAQDLVTVTSALSDYPISLSAERISLTGIPGESAGTFLRYLRDMRRYPLLSQQHEYRLALLSRSGNTEARDTLVRHNLRFVITIAKKYASHGFLFEDLVQEGNIGLMRAVSKFDPNRGVKLVSYAAHWIEQAIRVALAAQGRAVRLPTNRVHELSRVRRSMHSLRDTLHRTPSVNEVASHAGLALDVTRMLMDVGNDVRLDAPLSAEDDVPVIDRFTASATAEARVEDDNRELVIGRVLSRLKSRDATVLKLWFGIGYGRDHTLEEVGLMLGVSRERARQLRDQALERLRNLPDVELLRDFWLSHSG